MKTYTKDLTRESSEGQHYHSTGKSWLAWFALRISLICLMIFGAVACRVYLSAEIEIMNKQAARIETQAREVNIQISNYRNRKEKLTSWPVISRKIAQYHLKLQEADYRQISYTRLLPELKGSRKYLSMSMPQVRPAKMTARDYAAYSKQYRSN